jgi:hypothetical protein
VKSFDIPIETFSWKEIEGKTLKMYVGIDKSSNKDKTVETLCGIDENNYIYVLNTKVS